MNRILRTLLAVALLSGAATVAPAQVVWGGGGVGASGTRPAVDPATTTRPPRVRVSHPMPMQVYINGVLQSGRLSVDSGSGFSAVQQTSSLPQAPSHASGGSWNGSQPVWGGSPSTTGAPTAPRTPRTVTSSRTETVTPAAVPHRPAKIEWGSPSTAKGSRVP
jgi:hypothetical protein